LQKLAVDAGFIQRTSKITAIDFVRSLLFDHLHYPIPSLQQHALSIFKDNGSNITKQALDKRFNDKALEFIRKLFELLLARQLESNHLDSYLSSHFEGIKVMDSTEFQLPNYFIEDFPGYSLQGAAACAAIQLEYDVLSRKINFLAIGSARQSDKTIADQRMQDIKKGELILRDLGYYSTDSYLKIEEQQAFYISRLKAQVGIYKKTSEGFEDLNWSSILQLVKKSKQGYLDQWVYIGKKQKHRVRLIAWELPETEQQKRLQRKKKIKSALVKEDIIWSKLNVIITNIDATIIDAQQAYNLYKIRWQIEWMFKIWKSILSINATRKMKTSRFKCYLYSKFIWILLCWEITGVAEADHWAKANTLLSFYKCMAILKTNATALKHVLFACRKRLRSWLRTMIKMLTDYGQKENRKSRIKLSDLLQLKPNGKLENTIFGTSEKIKPSVAFTTTIPMAYQKNQTQI